MYVVIYGNMPATQVTIPMLVGSSAHMLVNMTDMVIVIHNIVQMEVVRATTQRAAILSEDVCRKNEGRKDQEYETNQYLFLSKYLQKSMLD